MAQTNFTPISLYYSTTASAVPVNTNLANGELAINITDGKLFYKDNSGAVQTIASKATATLVGVANGGTGTATPALVAGTNVTITGTWPNQTINASGGGSGTVTSVSVTSGNGLAGTVTNPTTTPAITLSTTITGILKGNSTAISAALSGTDYAPATSGTSILYGNGSGGFSNVTIGSGLSFSTGTLSATGGGGGVSSVTATSPVASSGGATPVISLNSGYGDTLNPYASKTQNYVLAAPNGTGGVPTFRALVAADIPTLNQNTSGTAAGLSATLVVSSGGTGQSTYTDGQLLIGNSTGNTLTKSTLTAGSGVTITNSAGGITIAATGSGVSQAKATMINFIFGI
jgi:hypothetical protein